MKDNKNLRTKSFFSSWNSKSAGSFKDKYHQLVNIFNHINDGVITTDEYLKVIYINKRAKDVLKIDYQQAFGKSLLDIWDVKPYNEGKIFKEFVQGIKTNTTGASIEQAFQLVTGEKEEIIISVILHPIFSEDDELRGLILVFRDISREILIHNSVNEAESKFRAIYDNTNYGILIYENGLIIDCNQACLNLFKCKKEQLIGKTPQDFSPEYQPDGQKSSDKNISIQQEMYKNEAFTFEWLHKNIFGVEFIAQVSLNKIKMPDGNRIVALIQDITDRKKTEENLRKSESRYKSMFLNSASMMLIIDPEDGTIIDANKAAINFYGYSPEEFKQQKIHDINQLTQEQIQQEMEKARLNKVNYFEFKHRIKRGEIKDVAVYSGKVNIDDHEYLYSIIHDITDKKKMEIELFEREKDLKLAQQISHMGSWKYEIKKKIFHISEELGIIFNLDNHERMIPLDKFLSFIRADYINHVKKNLVLFASGEKLINDEFVIVTTRGFEKTIRVHGILYLDQDSNPEKILGTALDITDIKENEEQLRSLTQLIEQSPIAIIQYDAGFQIAYINEAGERLYGYKIQEIYNKGFEVFINNKELLEKIQESLIEGLPYKGDIKNIVKGGQEIYVNLIISPIYNGEEKIIGYMSFSRDITKEIKIGKEKRKLEEQVQQSEKLKTIGTLAGGIAHDFNNILTPILGYADMAKLKLGEDSVIYEDMAEIYKAALRARELISQMLSFSKSKSDKKQKIHLAPIVKEAVKLLRPSIPTTIKINLELQENIGVILGDSTKIHQIIMNLCTNSYHAMEENGGTLNIKLKKVDFSDDETEKYLKISAGKYIVLTVRDTGSGMSKQIVDRMFDPFFTTKEVNKGTGLGLSVVHGIVEDHNGHIQVYSEPSVGTTINIYFPELDKFAQENQQPAVDQYHHGKEKILVIDDDIAITSTLSKMLKELSYDIFVLNDSLKALNEIENNSHNYDLVITDYTMPEMTGLSLAQKIRTINPSMPIVMITGNKGNLKEEEQKKSGIVKLICKPFLLSDISSTLKQIFDNKKVA